MPLAIVGDDGVRVATQAVAGKHAAEHAGARIALGIILMTLLWGEHLHVLVFSCLKRMVRKDSCTNARRAGSLSLFNASLV